MFQHHCFSITPIRLILLGVFLLCVSSEITQAEEPVIDRSSKMETIREDFGLADGPSWDGKQGLYVPDVKGNALYYFLPIQNKWEKLLPEAGRISATFYRSGHLYLSDNGNSRIAVLVDKKLKTVYQHNPKAKPSPRPNDLVVNSKLGVYYTLTGPGEVRYAAKDNRETDRKNSIVVANVKTPNGIILSPDEKTLYVSAYVPKEVWAYSVKANGEVGEGKLFAKMDDGPDKGADGMCVDGAGNVYCSGPAHVWIWNPAGKLLDKLETPTRPINCTFGDADMKSLYITGFGGLYRQKMNVAGRVEN